MKTIKNLTPHPIVILNRDGSVKKTYPVDGPAVRVLTNGFFHEDVDGVGIYTEEVIDVQNLPEYDENTIIIVSMPVCGYIDRDDLVHPYNDVRDENGVMLGCYSLAHLKRCGPLQRCF